MEGGAWNSETFGKTKPAETAGAHVPPAGSATPPMYHQPALGASKELKAFGFATVGLRIAQFVFTLLGFAVMASNKATGYVEGLFTTEETTVKFSSVESFIGLLALDVIVCFYALVQLIHSIVWASSKGTFSSSATTGLAMITFIFDLVLAFALVAAGGAAADSTQIWSQDGLCDDTGFPKFCQKAKASIVISFFAFAFLAFSCILYPLRLLRLAKQ